MLKKNVLFIGGVPDDRKVKVIQIDEKGRKNWTTKGDTNVSKHLENDQFQCVKVILDTRGEQELPRKMIHAVFNEISDADTHKITLHKADMFYQSMFLKIPFFNVPSRVMQTTRDEIYQLLQGIEKLHVPKTIKLQPKSTKEIYDMIKREGFEYPVIFRQAGDHGGISTIKVDNETEQFYEFPLDGREYYLTQFVEYQEDELYHKYRVMVVDGKIYLRHVKISEEWMVHHKNQIENPEKLQAIYAKHFTENKESIQETVTKIHERLKLDYFGIDCNIDKNGNLLVFEINPSMSVFLQAKGDIFSKNVDKIRQAVIKMIDSRVRK